MSPHFSGNFWWTTGAHYLKLPRTIGDDRHAPEFHILSAGEILCDTLTVTRNHASHAYRGMNALQNCTETHTTANSGSMTERWECHLCLRQHTSSPTPAGRVIEWPCSRPIKPSMSPSV